MSNTMRSDDVQNTLKDLLHRRAAERGHGWEAQRNAKEDVALTHAIDALRDLEMLRAAAQTACGGVEFLPRTQMKERLFNLEQALTAIRIGPFWTGCRCAADYVDPLCSKTGPMRAGQHMVPTVVPDPPATPVLPPVAPAKAVITEARPTQDIAQEIVCQYAEELQSPNVPYTRTLMALIALALEADRERTLAATVKEVQTEHVAAPLEAPPDPLRGKSIRFTDALPDKAEQNRRLHIELRDVHAFHVVQELLGQLRNHSQDRGHSAPVTLNLMGETTLMTDEDI